MRIAMALPYAGSGFRETAARLVDYERAGLDRVTVREAYGWDAVSQLGYLAAVTARVELASGVLPLPTRTPALLAMTAAGLDHVSGGRFVLGLGVSGPQVVEGFHGVPADAPLARTRAVVGICRTVWRREPLTYRDRHYRIPLTAEDGGTGLGKPLKLINRPERDRIPIVLAAMGPRSVALAAEIAEGWEPIWFHPERAGQVWGGALAEGAARRAPALGALDVVAPVHLAIGAAEESRALAAVRADMALYAGGMGARRRNFYHDLMCRFGYPEEAGRVQELYLAGRRQEAAEAVPEELARAVSLVGTEDVVRKRVAAFREAGVTTLSVVPTATTHAARVDAVGRLRDLAGPFG
ncbi:LLM class F420-dependent oxidoreductase [Streptomyces griseoaurantiacus]|uniref:LLM class F420-dependent oxidoreductase n=1 Tax=Streptomyces griseoaurantiacus TaxID=68213 RepID=UPI001781C0E1|nr:LLM class F420-dependent oxidoreductase [Streptomyces jietaisiensis]WTI30339.1 LLM class F420-dependent oxidoreductase [Streptomyces jietaisiensis]GHE68252.1 LLM class F420-dependent oxidoreductase [Streptomyces griseoaurantiacus]